MVRSAVPIFERYGEKGKGFYSCIIRCADIMMFSYHSLAFDVWDHMFHLNFKDKVNHEVQRPVYDT